MPDARLLGLGGLDAQVFDLAAEWKKRCANVRPASLPGGHFFVDQFPAETAKILEEFISSSA